MQTNQSEEPRALSLQEMEETNGGKTSKAMCYTGMALAYAGFLVGCATGAGALAGALIFGSLIHGAISCYHKNRLCGIYVDF